MQLAQNGSESLARTCQCYFHMKKFPRCPTVLVHYSEAPINYCTSLSETVPRLVYYCSTCLPPHLQLQRRLTWSACLLTALRSAAFCHLLPYVCHERQKVCGCVMCCVSATGVQWSSWHPWHGPSKVVNLESRQQWETGLTWHGNIMKHQHHRKFSWTHRETLYSYIAM